jgi:hypothetical protein
LRCIDEEALDERALEIRIEIIFELLFEVVGQLFFEALFRVLGRSAKATTADLFGSGESTLTWRAVSYALLVAIAASIGIWRGSVADGTPTFGLWVALVGTLVCVVALVALPAASPLPPTNGWKRVICWWPRRRLAWFAVANAAFAIGYLIAL